MDTNRFGSKRLSVGQGPNPLEPEWSGTRGGLLAGGASRPWASGGAFTGSVAPCFG